MSPRTILAAVLAAGALQPSYASPPVVTEREIDALLDGLGESRCRFQRNGDWHDAERARAHIERKYAYLARRDLIATTEDFIVRAASRSERSGRPYRVECDGTTLDAEAWLRRELGKLRRAK